MLTEIDRREVFFPESLDCLGLQAVVTYVQRVIKSQIRRGVFCGSITGMVRGRVGRNTPGGFFLHAHNDFAAFQRLAS